MNQLHAKHSLDSLLHLVLPKMNGFATVMSVYCQMTHATHDQQKAEKGAAQPTLGGTD